MRLYHNRPSGTVARARSLRREASEPERRLLCALREAFPTQKWRHQAPVGPFYADILCFSEKLVIEIDGDTHATREQHDAARTRFLEQQGYHVIRFANAGVMENLEGVLSHISFSLREKEGARAAKPCGKDEGNHDTKKGGIA